MLFAPAPDVAALGQLQSDVRKILLRLRLTDLLDHALQIGKLLPALSHELGEHLLRRLGLIILLKILRRILLGRQAHIQGDGHPGTALLIVVLRLQGTHTPAHAVEVGGNQLAADAQVVPILGFFVLPALHSQLPAQAVSRVGGRFQQILPFLPHPVRLLPLPEKIVQHGRKALTGTHLPGIFILLHRVKCKVSGLTAPLYNGGLECSLPHPGLPGGKHLPQALCPTQAAIGAASGPVGKLPCPQGGQGREGIQQELIRLYLRPGLLHKGTEHRLFHIHGRLLFLPGRQVVEKARQHLSLSAHFKIHPAQAIEDTALAVAQY